MAGTPDQARLRRLIEVGPWLISQLDLETVLDRFLRTAKEVTGARYAALGVLDVNRERLERFITVGLDEEQELAIGPRPHGSGILGQLITDPRPLRLAELTAHASSYGFPPNHPPMRRFLGVPILIEGDAWGNLYLTDKEQGDFDEGDEFAAVTLASWAAIAIEHARLLAASVERQERLERALRGLEATQAIAVAVGADTDLGNVLELIATRGRRMVEARTLLILLQRGAELEVVVSDGEPAPPPGARVPVAGSTSGQVIRSGRAARLTDAAELQVPAERLGVPDAHAALMVPLVYRGQGLGVLAAFDRADEMTFSEADEQLLLSFAASAATAVATAQTVQADRLRHSLEAAEAERKFWARELHDETLQGLGGLKVLASAARRAGDTEQAREALGHVVAGLETEIENLHAIITELRPAALDDLGLRPAIEALAERHTIANGIEIERRLQLPDPALGVRRLAPELETAVYRLIQEALSNVAKHSGAHRSVVTVEVSDGWIELEVADDGHGFDPAQVIAGFGLTGMQERAALAGGTVDLRSSPGAGAVVRVRLPARYADPGPA